MTLSQRVARVVSMLFASFLHFRRCPDMTALLIGHDCKNEVFCIDSFLPSNRVFLALSPGLLTTLFQIGIVIHYHNQINVLASKGNTQKGEGVEGSGYK